jgi:hypothetical protein
VLDPTIGSPGASAGPTAEREAAVAQADAAVKSLRQAFFATPYRPTGLNTTARAIVRLIDELSWLNVMIIGAAPQAHGVVGHRSACTVRSAAATVLESGADLLASMRGSSRSLLAALEDLERERRQLERGESVMLPAASSSRGPRTDDGNDRIGDFVSSLDPSFRAQELSFAVSQIGANIDLAAAAERRNWFERLLGRQPQGIPGTFSAAQERAGAHTERHSVWLHNSVRGAVALALAVLVAKEANVQHSFWVVFGTLSVLRSNAFTTGENIVRGLAGTVVGFVVGAALVSLIGTNSTVLWLLLPPVVLLAGLAPAAISFAAGQAAFTLTLLILFNLLAPVGWRIGIARIEDVAIGSAVSLVVGLLFWPRGAGAALGRALATAYRDGVTYLVSAVEFGLGCCDFGTPSRAEPTAEASRAAAASRRLDDAFREYLAERGEKPITMAEVTELLTGAMGLRLAADAILDLWQRDGADGGDRGAARVALLASAGHVADWYTSFADSLTGGASVPEPLVADTSADGQLLAAVGRDLRRVDGAASATAARVIWTGDHLDAARRMQETLVAPARAVNALRMPNAA